MCHQLLSALSSAHSSLCAFTTQHKLTVEEVEKVQDGWRDVLEQQEDVNAALAHELNVSVDDEQVEAEYQQMLHNEAAGGKSENALMPVPTTAENDGENNQTLQRAVVTPLS